MSGTPPAARGPLREFGRFLEIQNLGLNLPFALAFLLIAAGGLPSLRTLLLVVVAFVGARNAGHAFNRWTDRELDRANPRTRDRALPSGRYSPGLALAVTAASAALLLVAAALLNSLALLLAPVALALLLGYSLTKRLGWGTTLYLGLVESITPPAAFVAVDGSLPVAALVAGLGLFLWGSAFETIHSLGDIDSDRAAGLSTIPVRFGRERAVALVPLLHAGALLALVAFGLLLRLSWPFDVGLLFIALLLVPTDRALKTDPSRSSSSFRRHITLGILFLGGSVAAVLIAFV